MFCLLRRRVSSNSRLLSFKPAQCGIIQLRGVKTSNLDWKPIRVRGKKVDNDGDGDGDKQHKFARKVFFSLMGMYLVLQLCYIIFV